MLKRILLLISLFFCLSFTTASAENWVHVERVKVGRLDIYIDTESIHKDGDIIAAKSKTVSDDGSQGIYEDKFNMKERTIASLSTIATLKDGKSIKLKRTKDVYEPIDPVTTTATVYDYLVNHILTITNEKNTPALSTTDFILSLQARS